MWITGIINYKTVSKLAGQIQKRYIKSLSVSKYVS